MPSNISWNQRLYQITKVHTDGDTAVDYVTYPGMLWRCYLYFYSSKVTGYGRSEINEK